MSLKYRDHNGVSRIISGITPGGNMETGAVATREGTAVMGSISPNTAASQQIEFVEALPDADYCVFTDSGGAGSLVIDVHSQTVDGFRLNVLNLNSGITISPNIKWKAFKLYEVADAEALYSTVQDIEDMIPSNASSTNKFATADDLRTDVRGLDRRLDDVEDAIPTSASITNKLVTQSDLSSVEIDKVEDINDVELTDIQDGQTLIWDDSTSKWVNGQGGKTYSAGDGINISNTDEISAKVDDTSITTDTNDALKVADTYKTIFVGTRAEWDALSTSDKVKYNEAHITDDVIGGEVADEVTDGDMRPVTSNAVYNGLATKVETSDIVNNLTSTSTTTPLSAAQGKVLNDNLTGLISKSWSANSGFSYVRIGKMVIFRLRSTMPVLTQSDSVRWTGTQTGIVPSAVTPKSAFSTTGVFTYLGLNGSISLTFNTNLSVTFEVITTNNVNPYNNWYECVGMYEIN